MQMVKKGLIIFLSVIVALVVFAPKKSLYYLLESELQKNGVVLSDENISENPIGVTISNAKVYVENTYIGDIQEISLLTLLFYNDVTLTNFIPTQSIKRMLPISVDSAKINYAIWDPLKVSIFIQGSMGIAQGEIDITEQKIILRFNKDANIAPIRGYLKKDQNGWYYEQNL
jgi:hypothetical protein